MILVKDVLVDFPQGMAEGEAVKYAEEEMALWADTGKILDKVTIEVDGAEVVIRGVERSPIRRVRRITGYLSEVGNFNDAKRAELRARVKHN